MRRRGFTLVEVVTVLAVIAVIAAIGAGIAAAVRDRGDDARTGGALDAVHAAQIDVASRWGRFTPDPSELPEHVRAVAGVAARGEVSIGVTTSGMLVAATPGSEGCDAQMWPTVRQAGTSTPGGWTVTTSGDCSAAAVLDALITESGTGVDTLLDAGDGVS